VHQVQEAHGLSERRSCIALGVGRSSIRYRSIKPDQTPCKLAQLGLDRARGENPV
jgi:putative transposase